MNNKNISVFLICAPGEHDKEGTRADVSAPHWSANDWLAPEETKILLPADQSGADTSALVSSYHWVWRFITQKKTLWARVIKAIHGGDGKIGKTVNHSFPSIWLNIIQEVDVLKSQGIDIASFIKPKCGDGKNTSFWNVAWRGDVMFKDLVPRLYMLESMKDIQVATKLSHEDLEWSFRRKPRGGVEQVQMSLLKEKIEGCTLSDLKDSWTWSLEGSGEFSVSSIRKVIDVVFLPCGSVKTRWVKEVPIKINIHAWKVINDYLPTRFNLSRRGMDIGTIVCPMCNCMVESSRHLFFSCELSKQIMCKISRWWDLVYREINSYEEWVDWMLSIRFPSKLKKVFEVSEDRVEQAATRIGCGVLKAPFAYLGSIVDGSMSRIKSWEDIVGKMAARLSKWKMKTLSIDEANVEQHSDDVDLMAYIEGGVLCVASDWWRVLDCLPTRLNLSRRGIDISSILCPICDRVTESSRHLFFECHFAKDIFRIEYRGVCDQHNHLPTQNLEGHAYARRLSDDEYRLVEDLTWKNVRPREILSTLKDQNENNLSTLPTIYDAQHKIRKIEYGAKTPMQVLIRTIRSNRDWDQFQSMWKLLEDSPTWTSYTENYEKLRTFLSKYPRVLNYVNDTWLDKYKNHFVSASIDQSLNFGNRTTNRVESQHAKLKDYMTYDSYTLDKFVVCINKIVMSQLTAIKESFGRSEISRYHKHNIPCFSLLRGAISNEALDLMVKEIDRLSFYVHSGECIPLDSIDIFWRTLNLSPATSLQSDIRCDTEINHFKENFNKQSEAGKRNFYDVRGDGNCGFRSVALGLGLSEDQWPQVRLDLVRELMAHRERYMYAFGSLGFDNIYKTVETAGAWMIMPNTGLVIASAYNRVVILLANGGSVGASAICFPLWSSPPQSQPRENIVIAHVNGNHYIRS
ncbi:RNA-directed DNA polymerase, eukaryota, reverse transcriptase zinc-binding domain protein [Tanacetum coccineum]